ncbi:hypothetical protein DFH07DRAFT_779374 [Mycena maculata]|uniref:Uncharacterized protein n=1 Tax=Mycena maculata TaxID=230809 RepID=A0AAD7I8K2_9AGAR|nr:hypothetical protein DFH07DRAFT_779374 [Mycena maculata]
MTGSKPATQADELGKISKAWDCGKALFEACQSRKSFCWEVIVLFITRDLERRFQWVPALVWLGGFEGKCKPSLRVYSEKNRRRRTKGKSKNKTKFRPDVKIQTIWE